MFCEIIDPNLVAPRHWHRAVERVYGGSTERPSPAGMGVKLDEEFCVVASALPLWYRQ